MAARNANYEQPQAGNKQQPQGGQQNDPGLKKRVYIGNLPPDTSREELRELGSKYGRVIQVELIRAKDGRLPFGFITFLSEEDAGYTAYMLHDHVYKGTYPLEASLSNSKVQPRTKPGTPRQGGNAAQAKNAKPKREKKAMYSLRTLTPLNPPTQTNQAVQPNMKNYTQNLNDDQGLSSPNLAPFGWTDNTSDVPQVPLGRASNPGQNNQDFNNQPRHNKFNVNEGPNRKNNNNNRNRGPAFRRAQDTPQFVGDEVTHDDFDNNEQIPVVVQDSPPALSQLPPQDSKRQKGQGQGQGQNRNTNNPKGGQQKNKLGSNSGGPQHTVDASIQYTQGGPTSNVQVNVATAPKKISINFKLNVNQLEEFLDVIQPYVQEVTQ
jgi:RNA recognition motif-containing protein